jgi:uncharacterized membrane protein YfcA
VGSLLRALIRFAGWLLTPLVAWAASFVGAWLGAAVGSGARNSTTTLWLTAAFGIAASLLGAWAWLRLLRRSPRLQKTLAVAADGTPLVAIEETPPEARP